MEHVSGKNLWLILEPFRYETKDKTGVIEVPAGFDTDLASVPRVMYSIFPRDGLYIEAAIIHDWLYVDQKINGEWISRKTADGVFLEAMEYLGIGWFRRRTIYRGVRIGGWTFFNKRAKKLGNTKL